MLKEKSSLNETCFDRKQWVGEETINIWKCVDQIEKLIETPHRN